LFGHEIYGSLFVLSTTKSKGLDNLDQLSEKKQKSDEKNKNLGTAIAKSNLFYS